MMDCLPTEVELTRGVIQRIIDLSFKCDCQFMHDDDCGGMSQYNIAIATGQTQCIVAWVQQKARLGLTAEDILWELSH